MKTCSRAAEAASGKIDPDKKIDGAELLATIQKRRLEKKWRFVPVGEKQVTLPLPGLGNCICDIVGESEDGEELIAMHWSASREYRGLCIPRKGRLQEERQKAEEAEKTVMMKAFAVLGAVFLIVNMYKSSGASAHMFVPQPHSSPAAKTVPLEFPPDFDASTLANWKPLLAENQEWNAHREDTAALQTLLMANRDSAFMKLEPPQR